MIGPFLIPMTGKGLKCTESFVTTCKAPRQNQQKISIISCQQEMDTPLRLHMEIPTTDPVDQDTRIAIVFPGLIGFLSVLAASFVTILTTVFATWEICSLSTVITQKSLLRTSLHLFKVGVSRKSFLFLSPLTFPSTLGSALFCFPRLKST